MSEKTTLRKQIEEFCDEHWPEENILLFGGEDGSAYDAGFLGIGYQQHKGPLAIYDREKCLDALAEEFAADTEIYEDDSDADPYTDALEWFSYNTERSWVGESPPLSISRFDR